MTFHFDDKEQIFNQYLIRKINLLYDAEIIHRQNRKMIQISSKRSKSLNRN